MIQPTVFSYGLEYSSLSSLNAGPKEYEVIRTADYKMH